MVRNLKILSLLNDNYKLEERKFESQRREMAKAYKNSSSFIEASKNPVTNLINDLLKSEKELPKHLLKTNLNSSLGLAELEVASSSDFHNEEIEPNRFHHLKDDNINYNFFEFSKFNAFLNNSNNYDLKITNKLSTRYGIPENILRLHLNDTLVNRKFQKAISTYKYQMSLAEKGFESGHSKYTIIA